MAGVTVAATGVGDMAMEGDRGRCGVPPDKLDGREAPESDVWGK